MCGPLPGCGPVRARHHHQNGRAKTVLISAAAFETLVKGRVTPGMEDLDAETLKAIAAAEVPAQYAYLDNISLE